MYISCILCFQSGGGGATSGAEIGMERLVMPGGHQVNRPGEMEIVSKTCVYFGMKGSVIELLVVRDVKLITPNFLLHSNYDWQYYKCQYQVPPTNSSPDPKEHSYGPEDPRALPK